MTKIRTAAVQIRGATGPLWANIYWPPGGSAPPLLVYFTSDSITELRTLCLSKSLIVLAAPAQYGLPAAKAIVGWAADHASELEADPDRLLIAGTGDGAELAIAVFRIAEQEGWPELTLLTDVNPLEGIDR